MKAAVFFPGIGYHCDKPLLYYSRKLAQECGYEETIALSYTYDGGNIRGNEEKMQQAFESLYGQAEKSLSAIDLIFYCDSGTDFLIVIVIGQHQITGNRRMA